MTDAFQCVDCGWRTFYEKERCLECGGDEFEPWRPGEGELLSVTTIRVTPDGVREPNRLGLAVFEGGASVVAQLDGDLAVGDAVVLSGDRQLSERRGSVLTGPQFVPAGE